MLYKHNKTPKHDTVRRTQRVIILRFMLNLFICVIYLIIIIFKVFYGS